MALEMRDFVINHPELSRFNLDIHSGIATGPVVAGVIGTKRFIYDLWGDTVNVASRLTDEAVGGVIQVDKTTFNRVRQGYAFDPPAAINVKGKGEMVMYRLRAHPGNVAHPAKVQPPTAQEVSAPQLGGILPPISEPGF